MTLCECGCGAQTSLAAKSNRPRGHVKGQPMRFLPGHNHLGGRTKGYIVRYRPAHPRASSSGGVVEHVLIAEAALGKRLPIGSEVHHVDENTLNNASSNLVICQDKAYHKLLHVRARVVRAGGDPNTERVCSTCRIVKPFAAFNRMSQNKADGHQRRCRECQSDGFKTWNRSRKSRAA